MDTNVLYAGLRSRRGASFQILDRLWQGQWTLVLSNTVLTEYEELLKRKATTLGLTFEQITKVLDGLCVLAERRRLSEVWHPVLRDPDDEALVHLSVESGLGVNLLEPREFLAILRP
jgi:predicted nucleic acid-binding protein